MSPTFLGIYTEKGFQLLPTEKERMKRWQEQSFALGSRHFVSFHEEKSFVSGRQMRYCYGVIVKAFMAEGGETNPREQMRKLEKKILSVTREEIIEAGLDGVRNEETRAELRAELETMIREDSCRSYSGLSTSEAEDFHMKARFIFQEMYGGILPLPHESIEDRRPVQ